MRGEREERGRREGEGEAWWRDLCFRQCILIFNGTNNLINNSAGIKGGAIHANSNSILDFNGSNNFAHNSAKFGGAIHILSNVLTCIGSNTFSTTQLTLLVVQSLYHTVYSPLMEPTTSLVIQQTMM